jgi:hypothetical protein
MRHCAAFHVTAMAIELQAVTWQAVMACCSRGVGEMVGAKACAVLQQLEVTLRGLCRVHETRHRRQGE